MLADTMSNKLKWFGRLFVFACVLACFAIEVRAIQWIIRTTWPDSTPGFLQWAIMWGLVLYIVGREKTAKK